MASNEYLNMAELIKDYYDMPVGTYLNQSVTINEVSLPCDIYRVASETVLTSAVFTGCTAVDANTQIVIGKDMSVASETTLIPPYRCKGIFIGDVGTFTNSGTISMTARGASGAGKNIKLTADYQISATGGAGGASVSTNDVADGNSGSSPSSGVLSCGGGGSGSAYSGTSGRGGNGTSFSGGAGSGGAGGSTTQNGSDTGGAGSDGNRGSGSYICSGGVGNPGGDGAGVNELKPERSPSGTGGLIVIIANAISNNGSISSNGLQPTLASWTLSSKNKAENGGSSGGGCVVLLAKNTIIQGTINTNGGAAQGISQGSGQSNSRYGGAGGAGAYASYIVDDLVLVNLPVEIAISDSSHLNNIDPSESVRLLGLTDKDEFFYEIMGTRHSVGGGHSISDGTTTLTQRSVLEVEAPLTATDDSTNEKTVIGADTSVDKSLFIPPSQAATGTSLLANLDDTAITNPSDEDLLMYDATAQKWKNGTIGASDGNPVGTIINFFGDSAPTGYLACDGSTYNREDYPALVTHLLSLSTASTFAGNGTTTFTVPDLRGEFLRGSGTNGHTNQGNGSVVGVHQDGTEHANFFLGDSLRYLYFGKGDSATDIENTKKDSSITGNQNARFNANYQFTSIQDNFPGHFTSRPTNTSVLYCIKY